MFAVRFRATPSRCIRSRAQRLSCTSGIWSRMACWQCTCRQASRS